MKTLVLFENTDADSFFFETEGFHGDLNGIYINGGYDKISEQNLTNLVYDENGDYKITKLEKPTKDWDYFIKCGFLS